MSATQPNSSGLWGELGRRTRSAGNRRFLLFLLFGIFIFSGLGIWIEVVNEIIKVQQPNTLWSWDGILLALSSYYPALLGAASLQLNLEANRKSDDAMADFSLGLLFTTFILIVLIGVFQFNQVFYSFTFWGTFALSALGIWVWILANCDNPDLKNDPSVASGGDTNRDLKGDVSGFRVK